MKINAAVLINLLLSNQSKINLQVISPVELQGMMTETNEVINNIMFAVSDEGVLIDYHETLTEMLVMQSGLYKLDSEDKFIYGCQNALIIAIRELMAMQNEDTKGDD